MHMSAVPWEARGGNESPRIGVTHGCEPSQVDTGTQTTLGEKYLFVTAEPSLSLDPELLSF